MVFFRADGTRELTSEPKAFGLELQWPLLQLIAIYVTVDLSPSAVQIVRIRW